YNENTHKGLLRHLVIRRTDAGYTVTIVINGNTLPHYEKLIDSLNKLNINYSLSVNINTEKTNVILGRKTFAVHGNIVMPCNICGVRAQISPQSFMQINDGICSAIYSRIADIAKQLKPSLAIDAYGGIGIISNLIAKYCGCVKCIEIVPSAIADGKMLAKQNGNENKIDNVLGDCANVLPEIITQHCKAYGPQNTLIILDPPRKGCEQPVLDAVTASGSDNVIYISCNPATLARDLQTLRTAYNIASVTPYDMFAQTSHVETLVVLSKK
ncbi:MAG: 23S rRNA (uracil(1939)-C(5))-methyltransferase RlmD, partial [Clostridia bacterium]|nr:23S rRNA (uracil(1939)-C(5))-methyltransferase RlmD [Clostridia bacterium]